MTKRICLLAGFHPKGQVADYVVYYTKSLAAFADVYYLADCPMSSSELAKLAPYTKGVWAFRHNKYDFGSWQELIFKVGWNKLAEYDECIFTNDSVIAPLFDLSPFIQQGSASSVDAWAMNSFEYDYFGSFFWVVKRRVLTSEVFKQFLSSVEAQKSAEDVIHKYEKKLPQMLREGGFSFAAIFTEGSKNVFDDWKYFIKKGFPMLKLKIFKDSHEYPRREYLPNWDALLSTYTHYPVNLVYNYLYSVDIPPAKFSNIFFKLKSFWWACKRWRRKLFRLHFSRPISVVAFGVTLYDEERANSAFPVPKL